MCVLCFLVVFLLGCSLYLLFGRTYTTSKAFGLYFKGLSSSFGLAIPYSIWKHQNFPLNKSQRRKVLVPFMFVVECHSGKLQEICAIYPLFFFGFSSWFFFFNTQVVVTKLCFIRKLKTRLVH